MPELTDRVALVTGSSRGIGAAIARLFAHAGASVVVHGRDEAALAAVRSQIEDEGGTVMAVAADANLTAAFLTVKSILPGMKERGRGVIITMASAASRRANPASPVAYAAAKAGIEIFTQDLAAQAGPFGVRANCIAPETILTERNEEQIPPNIKESLREQHPVRRLGTPDDVARAAASDDSGWITEVVLDVAGGAVMV